MTDGESAVTIAGALVSGFAALAAAVRWSVNRVVKAIDDSTKAWRDASETISRLATLLDTQAFVKAAVKDAVEEAVDEISGAVAVEPKLRHRTDPMGVPVGTYGPIRPRRER